MKPSVSSGPWALLLKLAHLSQQNVTDIRPTAYPLCYLAVKLGTCLTEACINLMWHGITAFDIYFEDSGEKVSSHCSFLWFTAVVLFVG